MRDFETTHIAALRVPAWRMVEAQHQIATRKLVDSNAEHELLEHMLERNKPPLPPSDEFGHRHYLLTTPFRYPPLRFGTRFGSRTERGIWYGGTAVHPTLAEVAFYRLLFLTGTRAKIDSTATEHSLFHVGIETPRGVDLTQPPFDAHEPELADPVSYRAAQVLGTAMREHGVAAFRFRSARDPEAGTNVGVFTPRAFASLQPDPDVQTWHCTTTRREVTFQRRGVLERTAVTFDARVFEVDGRIVAPA